MKLDYFKDCVIGTELKLDLFLERNRGLMYELTATFIQEWINSKAVVLRFSVEPIYTNRAVITLELLIDGVFCSRGIKLLLPNEVEA